MLFCFRIFTKKDIGKILVLSIITLLPFLGNAQIFGENHTFGVALSYGKKEVNAALSWRQMFAVAPNQKLKLGYGLRFNGHLNNDKYYTTAPANLTKGKKGPQVLFLENIPENIDTFSLHNSQHNSLNAMIYLAYQISPKWSFGFNIDAVGFSFGGEREGKIISSNKPANSQTLYTASPSKYNLLLIGDNDKGMLNSELLATYSISKKWDIGGGLTYLFTEYTTQQKISYNANNDRFRHKSMMGMIFVNFTPFRS